MPSKNAARYNRRETPLEPRGFVVSVTEDIIARAKPNHQSWCMVALAIKDIPGAYSIQVDASFIRFNISNVRFAFPTPGEASNNIQIFDKEASQGKMSSITPFKVILEKKQCYVNPIRTRKPTGPRATGTKNNKKQPAAVRRCVRRYNGLPVVDIMDEE